MNQPVLDFEEKEKPKSYFTKARIFRWAFLGLIISLVTFLDFIPSWQNAKIPIMGCLSFIYLVFLGKAVIAKESTLNLYVKEEAFSCLLTMVFVGSIALCVLWIGFYIQENNQYNQYACHIKHTNTFETSRGTFYVYEEQCWGYLGETFLKKRIYPLPIMYTICRGMDISPRLVNDRIIMRSEDGNLYDLETNQVIEN